MGGVAAARCPRIMSNARDSSGGKPAEHTQAGPAMSPTTARVERAASDECFPTPPEASISSSLRKAQVRAALFRKLAPVRVGRFTLLEQLGAGAMGEIYAAYDEQLDRRVALKLVRAGTQLTVKADDMLLREAQALAQVSHPNVVQIYEAGSHDGRLFIAMELIQGETLTRWLDDVAGLPRPARQRLILRRFIAAGRGLEAAHLAGVAHRDFKPDNVLVGDDGRVCVVDFGLARVLVGEVASTRAAGDGAMAAQLAHGHTLRMPPEADAAPTGGLDSRFATDATTLDPQRAPASDAAPDTDPAHASSRTLRAATRLTEPGTVMGTPRFMAPEQIRGALADHRSDQFSFCVALYHALYGVFPFAGERMPELLDAMETGEIGPAHSVGLPAGLRAALRRGLSVDPARRFATMGELLAALAPRRRRTATWLAGAALVAGLAAVVYARSSSAAPCANAGDGIGAAWSAERAAGLRAAFAASDLPYRDAAWRGASQRLDAYATRWRVEAIAACRATHIDHVQSAQLLDRRMWCLDHAGRQVAALTSELARGGAGAVEHAVAAAEALPDPGACRDTEAMLFGLAPPPAGLVGQIATVRAQLAQARTLEWLGRAEDALVVARAASAASERVGYPPVRAEALAQIARALDARGNAEARAESQRLYFDALDLAESGRHDQLAAEVWGRLVLLATRMDASTQQAHAWWRRSAAAVRRIGDTARDQARLHHALGELYYRDARYAEAADAENLAIAAIADQRPPPLELSRYLDALAKALAPQGRVGEAIALHERALAIALAALGPAHPDVRKLQINYGKALEKHGQLGRARAVLDAALASMPAPYRDSHLDAGRLHAMLSDVSYVEGKLDVAAAHGRASLAIYERAGAAAPLRAEAYTNLANVELQRGRFGEALAMYNDALALRRPHLGRDHAQIGVNEGSIAEALLGLGRHAEALHHVREAARIFERGEARDRVTQAWILSVHGDALVGLRRHAEAISVFERALPLFDGADPSNQARALWGLARALHGAGKDIARCRQLAERALDLFGELGSPEADHRDAVATFLERLSPAPASSGARAGDRPTQ
jgi:eukaryotic-like serine/threonine-protein kinase